MTILLSPHASPLPSWASRPSALPTFVSVPIVTHRAVSFSAALRLIVRWMTGQAPESSARDVFLERRVIEKLVEEMEPEPAIAEGNERQPT